MSDISDPELKKIIKSTQKILGDAIKQKGTSISDYRMPSGEKGNYQEVRRVYQRKGQPCIKCKGVVESFKQGQRTTFWCPKCQK